MREVSRPERHDEPPLGHVLIVEDCATLRNTLVTSLAPHATSVMAAATLAESRAHVEARIPDIVLLDHCLPDGTALEFMDTLSSLPHAPTVVAMSGSASREESFRLALLGVRQFIEKPLETERLLASCREARSTPPSLAPHLRQLVGLRAIHDVEAEVRATMLREALARAGENRRGAAKLLSISRQLLQHMLRRGS